jgi:hypothetical protein
VRVLAGIGWRAVIAAAAFMGALVLATGSALADGSDRPGSSIAVTAAPANGTLEIQVSGSNQPGNGVFAGFTYGVDLFIVDPKLLPGPCLPAMNAEFDLSESSPAAVADVTGSPLGVGASGPFSFTYPVDVHSYVPGPRLVCAYDMYFSTIDAAWASTTTTIEPGRPAATARPRVTRSGRRLSCRRGTWSQSPTSYRYTWGVVHRRGVAGRRSTLAVTSRLRGHRVECSVTATNSAGSATATSRPVAGS